MRPSSVTSIFTAAGTFGRPGIVMMSPASATTKPAPALTFAARIVRVKSSGAPSFFGSSEKDYCVLAMHTGIAPQPSLSSWASVFAAAGEKATSFAP